MQDDGPLYEDSRIMINSQESSSGRGYILFLKQHGALSENIYSLSQSALREFAFRPVDKLEILALEVNPGMIPDFRERNLNMVYLGAAALRAYLEEERRVSRRIPITLYDSRGERITRPSRPNSL